jgi:hypothetical protein
MMDTGDWLALAAGLVVGAWFNNWRWRRALRACRLPRGEK